MLILQKKGEIHSMSVSLFFSYLQKKFDYIFATSIKYSIFAA